MRLYDTLLSMRYFSPLFAGVLMSALLQTTAFAEKTGTSIIIEQQNLSGSIGKWTLLSPHEMQFKESEATKTFYNLPEGIFTLFVTPPQGANTTIRVHKGDELLTTVKTPQVTFSMQKGDDIRISISYIFTRVGTVGVQSDPAGLHFEMIGPGSIRIADDTPQSYLHSPEGQYAVTYETLEGCRVPATQSLLLEKDKRITFSLSLVCDSADAQRALLKNQQTGDDKYVTVSIQGQNVTFTDVPQSSWFASWVFRAAKHVVISRYKDTTGNLTGVFGPENLVTRGELAKIAHKIIGIAPLDANLPQNSSARNEWFASYIASAENNGWEVFLDATIDMNAPALRAEVVITLLQILNIPLQWQKGDLFSDVYLFTPFANAIETAAREGIIDDTQLLDRPQDPINRAEMAKLITIAMDKLVLK